MTFKKITAIVVFISFLYNGHSQVHNMPGSQIIPIPSSYQLNEGSFVLSNSTGITYNEAFKVSADFLKSFIENGSTIQLKHNSDIVFIMDDGIENPEAYTLQISPTQIEIKAKTDQGAFYAVQSILQLLPTSFINRTSIDSTVNIPCASIEDAPQYPYRGMHLDVARHFFSVDFIKKYIDALSMLKMNVFHWHLTDDQGWRIEIKKHPKLQEFAAFRNETLIGHYTSYPQLFDGKQYGGFYTQEQIKDVVAYAKQRHVTVIPEIEMPGHAQAAIAAYPYLGCTGEAIEVATKWGVFEDIFCTKEETFTFLENVLDEVLELFPSEFIHIGGDEAPKTNWKTCAVCQKRIKDLGLKDEHELQNYFITRIEKYLNSKGRNIIGWDEILEGGLAPNATVMSWRGIKGAVEAAKQHHNVIMTPNSHCYFDYYQSDQDDEPLAIGGFLPLEKVYGFNPIPDELMVEESHYILGAQGNVWTEYMTDEKQVEYMVFPRMLAMSEVAWSKPELKNYENFITRLENFHLRLDALDINYANHLFEVEGTLTTEGYELKTLTKDKAIHFTLDGSEPSLKSDVYSKPIPINQNTFIKAAVYNSEKQLGKRFTQTIIYHKAVGKKITLNVDPNKAYAASGAQGLINGIAGSDARYGDKEWLGFWGDDLEITIDLGKEMKINSVHTRYYEAQGQWIYLPASSQIELLNDKNESLYGEKINLKFSESDLDSKLTSPIGIDFETVKARYIKLHIQNYGNIPQGKQGAGNKAWTFIDEIIIK